MDGAVPDEIAGTFAGIRGTLEQTRRNVEHQLIQTVARLNGRDGGMQTGTHTSRGHSEQKQVPTSGDAR
jgi:hypothetical protein